MNIRKCSNPMNINGIEEWMAQFFTDPFTSLLDEHTFRVDLFETSEDYIIEAELGEKINKEEIQITASLEIVTISVASPPHERISGKHSKEEITRTIKFPFSIEEKEIAAVFEHGILEIKISKLCNTKQKQTIIPIK